MFFGERIQSIKKEDRVLEVGPGATPFKRSDVFLEKKYSSKQEHLAQNGYAGELKSNKQVVLYEGDTFPFSDNEFDYVICSHVLEHVENPDVFLKEIQRVAKRGYLEFPTLYYDFLYNFPEHPTLLNYKDGVIRWMPKSASGFNQYKNVQAFFYRTCELEYYTLIDDLKGYFFQGFEWEGTISSQQVKDVNDLCYDLSALPIAKHIPLIKDQKQKKAFPLKDRLKNKLGKWIDRW